MNELSNEKFEMAKALIGEILNREDLKYVDCYIHNKMGLFIPIIGPCGYAKREQHTHPSYMFVIFFSDEDINKEAEIQIKENQYL